MLDTVWHWETLSWQAAIETAPSMLAAAIELSNYGRPCCQTIAMLAT